MAPVGEGISELRIHYGAGYRIYFHRHGDTVVILPGGQRRRCRSLIDARIYRALGE